MIQRSTKIRPYWPTKPEPSSSWSKHRILLCNSPECPNKATYEWAAKTGDDSYHILHLCDDCENLQALVRLGIINGEDKVMFKNDPAAVYIRGCKVNE
jgi:hypothetical protein